MPFCEPVDDNIYEVLAGHDPGVMLAEGSVAIFNLVL